MAADFGHRFTQIISEIICDHLCINLCHLWFKKFGRSKMSEAAP